MLMVLRTVCVQANTYAFEVGRMRGTEGRENEQGRVWQEGVRTEKTS